jgi:hypothetical protein
MKTFSDIIKNTSSVLSENNSVDVIADKISVILERTEQILQRKLTNKEFDQFTDILISEEVAPKEDESKEKDTVFKKGKYTVEIITSEGKVTRTASSQKGLLGVIHGVKNYRVLDQNNRDITAKLKTFIKEKQKQALLRKKMIKKLKEGTERAGLKFQSFFNLREEEDKGKSSREAFYKSKLAEIQARTDLTDEQKQEAAQIIQDQLKRAETGPKVVEKGEETSSVSVKTGEAFTSDSPAPKRENYESEEDFSRDSKRWAAAQKGVAKTEQETTTASQLPTAVGERLQDPEIQAALAVGTFIPGVNLVATPLSVAAGAYGLKKQFDQGQFTGEADLNAWETAGNVLSILPGVGALAKGAKAVKAGRTANVLSKEIQAAKAAGKSADEIAALTASRTEQLAKAGKVGAAVTAPVSKALKVGAEAADAAKAAKAAKLVGAAGKIAKAGSAVKTGAKLGGVALATGGAAFGASKLLGGGQGDEGGIGDIEQGGSEEQISSMTSRSSSLSNEQAKRLRGLGGVNISYV